MKKRHCLKFIIAILSAFWMTVGLAGGPTELSPLPPEPIDYSGVYVDLAGGYAQVKWAGSTLGAFNNFSPTITGGPSSNGHGGATFGTDVGYQINKYLGLEGGWYYLPQVRGNSDIDPGLPPLIVKSWVAYLALKLMAPIWGKLYVFGKIGGSYRYLRYSDSASIVGGFGGQTNQFWSVMFATGLQYWFDQNWSVSLQYLHFPEHTGARNINRQAPTAHLIVGTVGYRFTL